MLTIRWQIWVIRCHQSCHRCLCQRDQWVKCLHHRWLLVMSEDPQSFLFASFRTSMFLLNSCSIKNWWIIWHRHKMALPVSVPVSCLNFNLVNLLWQRVFKISCFYSLFGQNISPFKINCDIIQSYSLIALDIDWMSTQVVHTCFTAFLYITSSMLNVYRPRGCYYNRPMITHWKHEILDSYIKVKSSSEVALMRY